MSGGLGHLWQRLLWINGKTSRSVGLVSHILGSTGFSPSRSIVNENIPVPPVEKLEAWREQ